MREKTWVMGGIQTTLDELPRWTLQPIRNHLSEFNLPISHSSQRLEIETARRPEKRTSSIVHSVACHGGSRPCLHHAFIPLASVYTIFDAGDRRRGIKNGVHPERGGGLVTAQRTGLLGFGCSTLTSQTLGGR